MRRFSLLGLTLSVLVLSACTSTPLPPAPETPVPAPEWSLVVHGGAGVITRGSMTPEAEAAYREALTNALETGSRILSENGEAIDAVEAVIRGFEDNPLFNAGKGAVMTETGEFSLDSSIMRGDTLDAGAVAGLSNVRHPISAARKVMEDSPHVMLAGDGADQFAAQQGLEIVDPSYFFTERRWKSLLSVLQKRGIAPPKSPIAFQPEAGPVQSMQRDALSDLSFPDDRKYGTVGVVALDMNGNIVAGTSTGGTTAKRWGRVGDSPIIGAGTYAENGVCGVSATGTGEYFIRLAIAHAICDRIELLGEDVQTAADMVIHTELTGLEGDGGVIVIGPDGSPVWSFNTEGMYRARVTSLTEPEIGIFGEYEDFAEAASPH